MDANAAQSPQNDNSMMPFRGSPPASDTILTNNPPMIDPMSSPSQIGKLTDDWSMELSPIAPTSPSRESFGPKAPVDVDDAIAMDPSTKEGDAATKIDPIEPQLILPNQKQPASTNTCTATATAENATPNNNSPSWYLGSEETTTTPPLANTSSEFSLESLSDDSGGNSSGTASKRMGEGGDQQQDTSLGSIPSVAAESKDRSAEDHQEEQKVEEGEVGDDQRPQGAPFLGSNTTLEETDPKDQSGEDRQDEQKAEEGKVKEATEPTTVGDHLSVEEESPSFEAETSLQPLMSVHVEEQSVSKLKLNESSTTRKQEASSTEEEFDNIATNEIPETSHNSFDNGDVATETNQRISPDADALIQDATEKVKRFIYELSILNASRQDVDRSSSESSTRSDSPSSGSASDDAGTAEHEDSKSSSPNNDNDDDHGVLGHGEMSVQSAEKECEAQRDGDKEVESNESLESYGSIDGSEREPQPEKKATSDSSTLSESVVNDARTWQSPPRRNSNADVSFGTPGTPRTPSGNHDYTDAKRDLGATSLEFIQRLRGAAQRRKQNLARSRDSLVAKEREQREAIAASKEVPKQKNPSPVLERAKRETITKSRASASTSFKAKPLPATNGEQGHGGLKGVPKVAKKPTTVPSSPLLGARRVNPPKVKALQAPVTKTHTINRPGSVSNKKMVATNSNAGTFKARPLPPTTGALGRSGQCGVPKVPKRPATVPYSPCLGARRRHSSVVSGKENLLQTRRISTGMVKIKSTPSSQTTMSKASPISMSSFSQASPGLLGLDFLSIKSSDQEVNPPLRTPQNTQEGGFEPSSTQRAKKRAEFEVRRERNQQRRKEGSIEEREKRVKELHKELDVLREII